MPTTYAWNSWCASTADDGYENVRVWMKWNTCIVTTANLADTWQSWITTSTITVADNDYQRFAPTPADEARWAREREVIAAAAAAQEAKRREARDRARALLLSMLDVRQREQLQRERFFEVIARHSRRRYRIHEGTHGNVRLLNESGAEVTRYCGQPNNVPTEDAMLAQKLQLELDEDAYIKASNATQLRTA